MDLLYLGIVNIRLGSILIYFPKHDSFEEAVGTDLSITQGLLDL